MLHSINYGTLSSSGSNGMGYCILQEKMATTTNSWMGPGTCLEETPDTWHHKVLIRERWQADEDTDADIVAPLPHGAGGSREGTGERPWGIMLAKPQEGQQQAKAGGPGTSSQTHVGTHRAQAHTGQGGQPPSNEGPLMPLPDERQ